MKKFLILFALLAFAPAAQAADDKKPAAPAPAAAAAPQQQKQQISDTGWSTRCTKDKEKKCEMFARLETVPAKQRVAEVALGFPQHSKEIKEGEAEGVIILPLGMLLPTGASIQVDDGKLSSFTPRFCNNGGCFSVVKFDKALLDSLAKGKTLNLLFKTAEGRSIKMGIALKGFDKALKDVK